ncbi:hypothetical protein PSPO01_06975 [Paraphaeosphaeria sporulosa]
MPSSALTDPLRLDARSRKVLTLTPCRNDLPLPSSPTRDETKHTDRPRYYIQPMAVSLLASSRANSCSARPALISPEGPVTRANQL